MKTYAIIAPGIDALSLVERDVPKPARGQVLVRMKASGLNYRDLMIVNILISVGLFIRVFRTRTALVRLSRLARVLPSSNPVTEWWRRFSRIGKVAELPPTLWLAPWAGRLMAF